MQNRMRELIDWINIKRYEYYVLDEPSVSDQVYDQKIDELIALENESGIIYPDSPTQTIGGECVDYLQKVEHTIPMLSAPKTKETKEIEKFCFKNAVCFSYKLDGLTIVVRYENGRFIQAITRGDGLEGEDITHNMRFCKTLPQQIPYKGNLEIRGEGVVSWKAFEKFNESFSHPRNLAGGSVRQLDTEIFKTRPVDFIAFHLLTNVSHEDMCQFYFPETPFNSISNGLGFLKKLGFSVVKYESFFDMGKRSDDVINSCYIPSAELYNRNLQNMVSDTLENFSFEKYPYPCDGIIVRYDNIEHAKSLGGTSHHNNDILAFKLADNLYDTILRDIEWQVGYDGRLFPTAVFDVVNINGSNVGRATLHNIDYIRGLELGIGDKILVSKRNMIIPCVEDNETRSNSYVLPTICPHCDFPLLQYIDCNTTTLRCKNPDCKEKTIQFLKRAVTKKGLNVDNLSESTIRQLVEVEIVHNIRDLFNMFYKYDLSTLPRFGARKVEILRASIEKARKCPLGNFIYTMAIPGVGSSVSRDLASHFKTLEAFLNAEDYSIIEGIGTETTISINQWLDENAEFWRNVALNEINVQETEEEKPIIENPFMGKTIAVTGTLQNFTRDSIQEKILSLGAKSSGSISKKTDFLLAGEKAGSKLIKAKDLGVQVLTEEEFISMIR